MVGTREAEEKPHPRHGTWYVWAQVPVITVLQLMPTPSHTRSLGILPTQPHPLLMLAKLPCTKQDAIQQHLWCTTITSLKLLWLQTPPYVHGFPIVFKLFSLLHISVSTQELLGSWREEQGGSGTSGADGTDAGTVWEAQRWAQQPLPRHRQLGEQLLGHLCWQGDTTHGPLLLLPAKP